MEFKGSSAYDQEDFLSNYIMRRDRKDSPNNAIEGPLMDELIGDVRNKSILDLGCGDASFGKQLLERGAAFYTGIEGSQQMAAAGLKLIGENGTILHETMESYKYPAEEYELVISRFALHYVEDIQSLFQNVHKTLKDGGRFVFSIQHPLTTSSFISKQSGDKRGNWVVDDYFLEGERKEPWIDKIVVKYHRTTEHYFKALINAGFSVVALKEGTPDRQNFSSEEEYERRLRIPIVLAFSCAKADKQTESDNQRRRVKKAIADMVFDN